MYSQIQKMLLLHTSQLQVRGQYDARAIATGINGNNVSATIKQRELGNRYGGTIVSRKLLDSVDACSKSLPHTNEAVKSARMKSEAMQHHRGQAAVFLTCCWDDENSWLIQTYTEDLVDNDKDMMDEDVEKRGMQRQMIRVNHPGFCAWHFETMMDILFEEVIGWDQTKEKPTKNRGLFGIPEAVTFAVKEQGRFTLHAHLCIWIQGYNQVKNHLFFWK